MAIKQVDCKKALTSSGLAEYDWSLNPYRGCTGGCAYCYVPALTHTPWEEWGDDIEVRTNIPNVLAKELKRHKTRGKRGVVGISTVTDPYQKAEEKAGLTRFCLQQLLRHDMPVSIITKNALVVRDLDLLSKFSMPEVGVTITTLDDAQRRVMEPGSSPIEERFDALRKASEAGLRTYAFLGPYYPTAGDEELGELAGRLKDVNVTEAIFDGLAVKEGVKECIEARLSKASSSEDADEGKAQEMRSAYDALFAGNLTAVYRRMYMTLEEKCGKEGVKLSSFREL